MDRTSVESNFSTTPKLAGSFIWKNDRQVSFIPTDMKYETSYLMKIPKNTRDRNGGYIPADIQKSFLTIGRAKVESIYPESGWKGVGVRNQIKVAFNHEVDRVSAQNQFV